jgi:hypothetical protein
MKKIYRFFTRTKNAHKNAHFSFYPHKTHTRQIIPPRTKRTSPCKGVCSVRLGGWPHIFVCGSDRAFVAVASQVAG